MGEKRVHKNQGPLLRLLHFHLYGATTANERRRLKTKAHITRAPRVVYRYKARFFFLPKGRSVNPLEATAERRRWLDARDDIFMYIYTIATKTMETLHSSYRVFLRRRPWMANWIATWMRQDISYAEDTSSFSCMLMLEGAISVSPFCFRVWRMKWDSAALQGFPTSLGHNV